MSTLNVVTASISDEKLEYVKAFLNALKIQFNVSDENTYNNDDTQIPQWHKTIVRERINSSVEEDYIPWDNAKDLL